MSVVAPDCVRELDSAAVEEAGLPESVVWSDEPLDNDAATHDDASWLEVVDDTPPDEPPGWRITLAGFLVSVLIHMWLATNLASWLLSSEAEAYVPILESKFTEPPPVLEIDEAIPLELANPDEREMEIREVTNAASLGLSQTVEPPKAAAQPRQLLDEARLDLAKLPAYDVPEGLRLDDRLVVKGSTGEQLVQIESALDRVTWEIAQNLQESQLLVVWLLDASASLKPQREAIARRLNRVYAELDALQDKTSSIPQRERGMLSAVVMFGEKTNFVAQPTTDFNAIRDAIESAPTDSSGIENVFTAVKQVVSMWSRFRTEQNRRILLITITDEAGDDFGKPHLEAIALCRRFGAKAFVIGPTSPFGQRKGFVPYVAPEDGKTYQLPIDLGPEVPMTENIYLPFWFDGPQYQNLSSGYAPYALARLVSETGGVYFLTNMTTMTGLVTVGNFDEASMKSFAPDYQFGDQADYLRDLQRHPLRMVVTRAADLSLKYKAKGAPPLSFRVTPQNFRQQATEAQKTVAESLYMIDATLQAFPPGIEKRLDQEPLLRWRLAFCLNYGRLLGNRVRNQEYNSALAMLKSSLSDADISSKSNQWIIHAHPEVKNSGVTMRKAADLATSLLTRVVAEAPGTPWAVMAARELKDPFGIRVEERFIPPPPPPSTSKNNATPTKQKGRPLFIEDVQQKKAQPKAAPPKPAVLPKL